MDVYILKNSKKVSIRRHGYNKKMECELFFKIFLKLNYMKGQAGCDYLSFIESPQILKSYTH